MNKCKRLSKLFLIAILGLSVSNAIAQHSHHKPDTKATEKPADALYYTCVMHPEIHSGKPGNCPKCGMKLILKTNGDNPPVAEPGKTNQEQIPLENKDAVEE